MRRRGHELMASLECQYFSSVRLLRLDNLIWGELYPRAPGGISCSDSRRLTFTRRAASSPGPAFSLKGPSSGRGVPFSEVAHNKGAHMLPCTGSWLTGMHLLVVTSGEKKPWMCEFFGMIGGAAAR